MIRNAENEYVFFDYDDMSGDWPIMDIAYLSDRTHFNKYSDSMFQNVERQFEKVYSGYGKTFTIGREEYHAIFDFIAIRH
jgi:Ser/Thr protein kinase RdoA (MazF antagonist)